MNSKVLLLSVAVIAVGLFAMPSTLSLFSGQHTFYNGSSVDCAKCHADIYSELQDTANLVHTTTEFKACEGCHRTNTTAIKTLIPSNGTANASTWNETNVTGDGQAHAAVTMECINCHSGVDEELNGTNAAHTAFYEDAVNSSTVDMKGANVACIGCHTHAIVNITWTRAVGYNLTSNATGSGGWDLTFSMNYSDNQTTYSAGE